MKPTTLLSVSLANLAALTTVVSASPLHPHEIINVRAALPKTLLFHATDGQTQNGSHGGPGYPLLKENITACEHITYDYASPGRTAVIREDCEELARDVQSKLGFWEMYGWTPAEQSRFRPLASSGTCEFAVQRLDAVPGNNSDVAIIGNQDVVHILNASIFDFAGTDEYYVDGMRNQGHMTCMFWFSVNATMEFRIQYIGS